uniref:alpha-mannosidase n=1 Tax=Arcella intermedia TaxID=1963864 RepID=A0A6B2KX21_9EUKA
MLTKSAQGDERMELYIEMACNGMFGNPADGHFLNPPTPGKTFTLATAEIAVLNREAWDLYWRLDILLGLAKELPEHSNRRYQAIRTMEKMVNVCYPDDQESIRAAIQISEGFFSEKNGDSQHLVTTLGHCHIDTAWLWCYSETRRKCARSWSTQLTLMDQFPNFRFTASQAQQFEWMEEHYPELFKNLQSYSKLEKFIPTGGTWVEMDCNIPSGESFVRQFLYGQRFFERQFGSKCTEFWLPDTFGYSAQLPQIIRDSEMEFFLTQKLSWNLINKFPHNTFTWVGIDGSEVLCHFPPADTYCGNGSVKELLYTVENNNNKDTTNHSMYLFGIGDGGGGPTLQMLERISRVQDVDGLPKLVSQTPHQFFQKVKAQKSAPKWFGELYFELHRGTYTTHAQVKKENRQCEFLLRDTEIFHLTALLNLKSHIYPKNELDRLWKLLLLNQFHDVLPGTSIGAVYKDTHAHHKLIINETTNQISSAINAILSVYQKQASNEQVVAFNTLAWERKEVVALPKGTGSHLQASQKTPEGNVLVIAGAPSLGWSTIDGSPSDVPPATVQRTDAGLFILQNEHIKATFDGSGHLISLIHNDTEREALCVNLDNTTGIGLGNQFVLYDDMPFFWDAWDVFIYHQHKRRNVSHDLNSVKIIENGPLRVAISFSCTISQNSNIQQTVYLDCLSKHLTFDTKVSWHENRKFLKVEFPLSVKNDSATYSIQFGNLQRPTHNNTSWDMAKFEVVGHHWADLSEYGFGVSLLSSSKYGFACHENTLRLSLLRSPKKPDEEADMGDHHFTYGIYPHKGSHADANMPRYGYQFNCPLVLHPTSNSIPSGTTYSLFSVSKENIIVETLKRAEGKLQNDVADKNEERSIILRLWESLGGRGTTKLRSSLPVRRVTRCNLLEESKKEELKWVNGETQISFSPFQIITLKLDIEY